MIRNNIGLFRGKRTDNGEWVEGYLWVNTSLVKAVIPHITSDGDAIIYEVDPDTVGECTGLIDRNGKLIFEDDIVRDMTAYDTHEFYVAQGKETQEQLAKYKTFGTIATVQYCTENVASCGCCYPSFVGVGFKATDVSLACCEAIGNIHDNPELRI